MSGIGASARRRGSVATSSGPRGRPTDQVDEGDDRDDEGQVAKRERNHWLRTVWPRVRTVYTEDKGEDESDRGQQAADPREVRVARLIPTSFRGNYNRSQRAQRLAQAIEK